MPNAPIGRVLVQVVAEGWKTYGRWYDIKEAEANHQDPSRPAAEVVLKQKQKILLQKF